MNTIRWPLLLEQHEADLDDESYLSTFDDDPPVAEKLAHLDRLAVGGTCIAPRRRYPLWKGIVGWVCAVGCALVVVALMWVVA